MDRIEIQKQKYNKMVFTKHGSLGYDIWNLGKMIALDSYADRNPKRKKKNKAANKMIAM